MMHLITAALLLFSTSVEGDWELKKDKDAIKVYTRSVEGSAIDEFKAVSLLKGTQVIHVLNVITNVSGFDKVFPDCSEAYVLEQDGRYNTVHYIKTDVPFPVSDRDGVYEQRTTIAPGGGSAEVVIRALTGRLPAKQGLVRITRGNGFWELLQVGADVKVTYQFHGDPGGSVPAWLANSFIVDHPFSTMENLRDLVSK
jgi:hypothetical protein